jgi:adenylate cyclase class 2
MRGVKPMEKLESEVKFLLADIRSLRRKILDLGARSQGRILERNLRFEDTNNSLKDRKCLLRLRHDQKSTLTFKSPPPEDSRQVKVLKELEVEISDFATMRRILESIGFHCQQVYEKWRETFTFKNTLFCLDTMPYGNFLEIEGAEKHIKQYARRLGLPWDGRILGNYLEIFDIIRKELDLKFTDVTFDNFKDIDVPIQNYLHLMAAGPC